MIDIVGLKNRPRKLLSNIVFFVANSCRCQHADTVGAVLRFDLTQFTGNQIQGFIPGRLTQCPIFSDQRGFEALG